MKKFWLFLVAVVFSICVYAVPVTENTARQIALNWYSFKSEGKKSLDISKTETFMYEGLTTMYMYTFKDGGFVIVAADDASIPVLGYSVENPLYRQDGTLNPEVKWWLEGYAKQIVEIKDKKLSNEQTIVEWNNINEKRFPKDAKDVTPLVQTKWDQMSPYNYYCPSGTPVGCVATSIAQIMNYHQWPDQGVSKHSFVHPTYGLQTADFGSTTYNWGLPNTGDNTNRDVAKLSRHCGVAVDMNYAPDGSGSQIFYLIYVLPNYFKYDQTTIQSVYKADYTDVNWIALLKSELDANRPIEYAGSSTASGGHAFVCDGYNSSNQFHFNWGWSGSSDGYFSLTNLNPGGYNFNDNQHAVIGIKPATTPEFKMVRKHSDLDAVCANTSPYLSNIHATSNSVAWGIAGDGSGSQANYKSYAKTTDGGLTWTSKAVTTLGGTAFSQIFGINDQIAYIAMFGNDQANNKILKTTDGGNNWSSILTGGHANSFFNVVHFFNQNEGFVQGDPDSEFELYTTTNGGSNWTRVPGANIPNPIAGEFGIVHHYTAVGNTIWFTTNLGRIYKSTDKGYNWSVYVIKGTVADGYSTYIDVAFSNDALTGLAHLSYSDGTTSTYEYYKTTDGGENWTQFTPTGNFYDSDLSAVPGVDGMFYTVGGDYQTPKMGVSYSTDGGTTWTELAEYYKEFQFTSIAMSSAQKGYAGSFAQTYFDGAWMFGQLEPLMADFSISSDLACINTDVTFTSTSTGVISSYNWNFGEGANPPTATGIGPHTVQYTSAGTKEITLEITDGVSTLTKTKNILVSEIAPVAIDTVYGCDTIAPSSTRRYRVSPQANVDFQWRTSSGLMTLQNNNNDTIWCKMPNFQGTYYLYVKGVNGCGTTAEKSKKLRTKSGATCDESLTTKDVNVQFRVYPNPATDYIKVQSNDAINFVEIVNVNGQTVLFDTPGCNSINVDLTGLPKGNYMLKITTKNETKIEKIIIQ